MMKESFTQKGAMMPARFCPQCGKEVSSAARFCPHCGASLMGAPAAAGPVAVTRMDTAARSTRRLLLPLVVAVLVVLAVAVALLASKLREESLLASRAAPVAAPPLTNAPLQPMSAPPITNAPTQPAAPAPPITNAPSTGPGQLPPDVAAYVKFLGDIEQQRITLDNSPALMSSLNNAITQAVNGQQMQNEANGIDPDDTGNAPQSHATTGSELSQPFSAYEQQWQGLIAKFRAQTAPAPCALLGSKYLTFLDDDYAGVVQMHVGILNKMTSTANGSNTQDTSGDDPSSWIPDKEKNDQEGLAADTALSELCQSYNAPKPFNIQPEGSSSSLLGQ